MVKIVRNFATQLPILITVRSMVKLFVCPIGMVKGVLYIARKALQLTRVKVTATKRAHVIGMVKIALCFVTQARSVIHATKQAKETVSQIGMEQIARNFATQLQRLITVRSMAK